MDLSSRLGASREGAETAARELVEYCLCKNGPCRVGRAKEEHVIGASVHGRVHGQGHDLSFPSTAAGDGIENRLAKFRRSVAAILHKEGEQITEARHVREVADDAPFPLGPNQAGVRQYL